MGQMLTPIHTISEANYTDNISSMGDEMHIL